MEFLLILLLLSLASEIIDGYTNCTSLPVKEGYNECLITNTSICTADEGTLVDLVCASCPPGFQGIRWYMWNLIGQYQLMPEYNGTGTIHFDKVREDQTDCYKCSCLYEGESLSALIGLQVNCPGKPHLADGKGQRVGPNTYRLPTVLANLTVHDKGRVCIDATCTGTPPLTYTWYRNDSTGSYHSYDAFEDAKCDSGIQIKDNPDSHLCILPTVRELCTKGDRIQQYMVNVSNNISYILVYADVEFPDMSNDGCSWFIRPHEKQSYGSITINADGTGTAYCAAYHVDIHENINFYLCKIDSSKKDLSACYFQDLQRRNQCISCNLCDGIQSEPESSITMSCSVKPITNHMGMYSRGCVLTFPKPEKGQMYSCIAMRGINANRVSSSIQGPELSDPQEIGTFQFVDPVPLTKKEYEEIFIPAFSLLLCLLVVAAIAGFILHKYRKKKKDYQVLERENREVQQRLDGVMEPGGDGDGSDSPESSLSDSRSPITESSFLLSSRELLRNYNSTEAATKRSEPIPIEASSSSSVESITGSISDSQTKSKVAEIDLECCASSTPSSKNSTVLSLPPRKQYDFTLDPNGKKISIYTDFVRQSPPKNCVAPLPDHIEEIVPISMPALLDFVDSMARCWERIGIKLDLEDKVAELRMREAFPSSHLIMLLEIWLQSGKRVSWARLVNVLENPAVNMGTVAANIKDFLIKQVPDIPDNIDFLVPMSVSNLMHLVASFAQHWETIGQLLKLEEEVEKLKKAPYTSYVKMTLLLESWSTLEQEFSWLNLLEKCEGRHELRPLVADIRQHLLKKMRELYKPTSAGKD